MKTFVSVSRSRPLPQGFGGIGSAAPGWVAVAGLCPPSASWPCGVRCLYLVGGEPAFTATSWRPVDGQQPPAGQLSGLALGGDRPGALEDLTAVEESAVDRGHGAGA